MRLITRISLFIIILTMLSGCGSLGGGAPKGPDTKTPAPGGTPKPAHPPKPGDRPKDAPGTPAGTPANPIPVYDCGEKRFEIRRTAPAVFEIRGLDPDARQMCVGIYDPQYPDKTPCFRLKGWRDTKHAEGDIGGDPTNGYPAGQSFTLLFDGNLHFYCTKANGCGGFSDYSGAWSQRTAKRCNQKSELIPTR